MCSSDNFFSNFIYLDVHNASLYYLQSCICTLHVRFPGTLYFKTIQTPTPNCGSVIHVTSSDGNQVHVFQCGGNTSFPVKTNDMINISIHNLGGLNYDTSYCYVISLGKQIYLDFYRMNIKWKQKQNDIPIPVIRYLICGLRWGLLVKKLPII